ncbi:Y-family DNA polymerase [Psychromonas sp. 14N.309.X.WAT.B.A12]|uniref:Y-family DNA polymerase n=1 Tax=Psychromonas sp. 14N.309.X.WAT.B.A12 TaxID=2998322 RepID=UPI0025AF8696|nr:Y-family DNA polymerase [Psychromonas sp. 14N.309.X.WAT.B.A12]MDN2662192.1 Y-family DNA polymerase [Psychromonas sp. 14N.309.X.WAT.B.A12]
MFALVDANSFYCSAEQVFRPEWRDKAIIVLSNNDGCIVAANKAAIALGVKKFQPYFKARALCEQSGVIVCSSNYELYADLSHKMMQVIGRFAPEQHIYSIDETFLDFNHCVQTIPNLALHAQKIRRAVWKETRLPVCVGIGKTLTLAKVANHVAKKWPGFQGVCVLDDSSFIQQVFNQLSPIDVWGIGRKTNKKLLEQGINTIQKLREANLKRLPRSLFNVELQRTINELNGIPCKLWDGIRADKLQIFSTRSMGKRITDIEDLHQALAKHIAIAAAKARQQGSLCGTLLTFASSSPFDQTPASYKVIIHFCHATNDTSQLLNALSECIEQLFNASVRYYKVGVGLLNLSSAKHQQFDLFNAVHNPSLMNVVDGINQRYGTNSVFFAAQGIQESWAMRRELLTPQYTTQWPHIPKIGC